MHHFSQCADIFKQFPGYVFWRSNPKIHGGCNQAAANLLGFNQPEELVGATEYDMRYPTANFAEIFIKQNKKVLSGKSLTIIDIHTYANNEPHLLLTQKFPFVNAAGEKSMIIHAQDIKGNLLHQIARQLMNTKYNHSGKSSYSYTLNGDYDELNLSTREAECLFLLSYGKTGAQIADILNLSARTVEVYIDRIKSKTHLRSRSELIEWAISKGYIYTIPKSLLAKNGLSMVIEELTS